MAQKSIIREVGKDFIESVHLLNQLGELDETFSQVMTPETEKGFLNGLELYPHQATIVKALLDLEDARVIKVDAGGSYNGCTHEDVRIETSALVLSEPFGSGKTFEILGLILHRPVPKAIADHANSITLNDVPTFARRGPVGSFRHEIIRQFTKPGALIRPNLIVVGTSVLIQWANAIKENTKLRVFVIGNYYSLKDFKKIFDEGKLKAFDIVLLKNGTVSNSDKTSEKEHDSLVNAVANITRGCCWSRVIYDDFDTIRIPPGSGGINALFTIYVSATTKNIAIPKPKAIEYPTLAAAFRQRFPILTNVVKDKTLFTNFNIRNRANYVENSTSIPRINKYRYVYANPDDNYIRLLGAMGEHDANNIMEMLNGDAIGTAADALGIKTNSVADIFQKMLDKKYEAYLHDGYVLDTIAQTKDFVSTLNEHPEGKRHSATDLEAIRRDIGKKQVPKLGYTSQPLEDLLDILQSEYTRSKEQNGIAINRVKDNIKLGDCQVCCMPLAEMDTFIVRCCGIVVCDVCGIKGNQIAKTYDYSTKQTLLKGSCANCKAPVDPLVDLIFVDKEFNMDALLAAKGDEKVEIKTPEPELVIEEADPNEPEIKNPKLKALLAIIRGKIPEGREKTDVKIKHLLEGVKDKPEPAGLPRKVLVFANFNETLELIQNFLTEHGIKYLRLGGTYKEMADTVAKFKQEGTVLLINSQHNCAGLNIAYSTDLVYFHKILDQNIESQVAGRSQRIGREYNLNLHYLMYANEKSI